MHFSCNSYYLLFFFFYSLNAINAINTSLDISLSSFRLRTGSKEDSLWLRMFPLSTICTQFDHFTASKPKQTRKGKELYCENPMILLRTLLWGKNMHEKVQKNSARAALVKRRRKRTERERERAVVRWALFGSWARISVFSLWGCSPVFISPETYDTTALCFESRRLVCLHSGVGREWSESGRLKKRPESGAHAADSVEETDWQALAMLRTYSIHFI